MAGLGGIIGGLTWRAQRLARIARFRASLRHLSGPKQIPGGPSDVIVIALVRDGRYFLEEFLKHYRGLGAGHFLFLDNGSTDGTPEILANEPDVTVLSSNLPWTTVENTYRGYAARHFCKGRWILYADMDEIFTFPGAEQSSLSALVTKLTRLNATAMLAQMLEMAPQGPLRKWMDADYASCLRGFDRYDLSEINSIPYADHDAIPFGRLLDGNVTLGHDLMVLFGGLRKKVFGELCCLTKHPLVFMGPDVRPGLHPHCSQGVRVAPVTGLIKHYKFAGDSLARDNDTLERGVSAHGEDAIRARALAENPDLSLVDPDAKRFEGLEPLIAAGFLCDWPEAEK